MEVNVFKKKDRYCIVLNDSGDTSDLYYVDDKEDVLKLHNSIKSVLMGGSDDSSVIYGDYFAVIKKNEAQYVLSLRINPRMAKGYKFSAQEMRHFASMLENLIYMNHIVVD